MQRRATFVARPPSNHACLDLPCSQTTGRRVAKSTPSPFAAKLRAADWGPPALPSSGSPSGSHLSRRAPSQASVRASIAQGSSDGEERTIARARRATCVRHERKGQAQRTRLSRNGIAPGQRTPWCWRRQSLGPHVGRCQRASRGQLSCPRCCRLPDRGIRPRAPAATLRECRPSRLIERWR
eukprot:scaffold137215_cov31-Tisochrysis_lutea.AAC.4